MTTLRCLIVAFVLVLVTATVPAGAQQPANPQPPASAPVTTAPKSFLPPSAARGAAPVAPAEQGLGARIYTWLIAVQGDYNRQLARSVREIKTGNPFVAALALASLSFMYGVLHAVGPGHGKAVISSYVLASDRTVRRGIALSFLAALFQAFSAILLVAVLVGVFSATGMARQATEAWLETLSWGLVVVIGVWLLWQQLSKLWSSQHASVAAVTPHRHAHSHDDHAPPVLAHALPAGSHAHGHGHDHSHLDATHAHSHDPHDGHDHSDCCGHAHMPDPKDLEGPWSWRTAIPLALAIGVRPCTGAIAILIFSLSQGLLWAGVFATFAMALGTAITVSALAVIAVGSRDLAAWLGGGQSGWGRHVRTAAGVGGALAVIAFGLILFIGSLQATSVF